ncbi:TPA: hypothetical protein DCQ44_03080 [Candidatus Taylorbacteria bacterium]|nr:hypothetical protein [Candidatus Taylorbacteria bacterium]
MQNSSKNGLIVVIIIIVLVVIGFIVWMSYNTPALAPVSTSTENTTAPASTATSSSGVMVLDTASTTTLGTHVVAQNGMTLYLYTADKTDISNCTGACAALWPPYTVSSAVAVSLSGTPSVTGAISSITRADGTLQITYKGAPLYFYSKDVKPGDIGGQGIAGVWFVVKP